MARIKEELKNIFKDCETYQEVYAKMPAAKNSGFSNEEINVAVSQATKGIKTRSAQTYKRIPTTLYNMNAAPRMLALPVVLTGNTDTNIIRYRNGYFEV